MRKFNSIQIISGGQTGIDQMGLFYAKVIGLLTGGMAPKSFKTEYEDAHWLGPAYGLMESISSNYAHRTRMNVEASHLTLIFGDISSKGTSQTVDFCEIAGIPCLINESVEVIRNEIAKLQVDSDEDIDLMINIAGNRASRCSALTLTKTSETLINIFTWLKSEEYLNDEYQKTTLFE